MFNFYQKTLNHQLKYGVVKPTLNSYIKGSWGIVKEGLERLLDKEVPCETGSIRMSRLQYNRVLQDLPSVEEVH